MVVATLSSIDGRAETALVSRKEVPRITFENISPPFNQYDYFQNRYFFPFEYDASSFSLINAWWLAEASTLVYSDDAFAWQRLRQAGFEQIQFFERSGTYCFLAANGRFAIVAFRGSEIWKRGEHFDAQRILADMKTNIDIRLSVWAQGGRVHSGFKAALEEVWNMLRPEIERLQSHGIKIWLTGHSLGAALATLAADRLQDVQGLYTFGSPRVGDKEFRAHFHVHAYRVVNNTDIVASMPGQGPYFHVGELIRIGPNGNLNDTPAARGEADAAGRSGNADNTGARPQEFQLDPDILLPRSFRDHNPMLYATFLWNALVQRLDDGGRATP